jgi:hypothetical protein
MARASASIVVPEAMMIESSFDISEAAVFPISFFSSVASFSFSFRGLLLIYGLINMAFPWLR